MSKSSSCTAAQTLSVPVGNSESVITALKPSFSTRLAISLWSVATRISFTFVALAVPSRVQANISRPLIFAKGFPGNRLEPYRAGKTATTFIINLSFFVRKSKCQKQSNRQTKVFRSELLIMYIDQNQFDETVSWGASLLKRSAAVTKN